jgi:hypothetical protein
MGRPKRGVEKPVSQNPDDRPTVINLKGTPDYVAWLNEANKQTHIPKATIVRLALALFAKEHGLPDPPVQ